MKNKISFLSILAISLIQNSVYAIPPMDAGPKELPLIEVILGSLYVPAIVLTAAFFIVSLVFGIAYLIRRKKLEEEKLKKAKGDLKFLLIGLSISALLLGITFIGLRVFLNK